MIQSRALAPRPFSRKGATSWLLLLLAACSAQDSGEGSVGGSKPPSSSSSGGATKLPGYEGPSLTPTAGPLPIDQLGDAYETVLCQLRIQCLGQTYRDLEHCKSDREPEGLQDLLDAVAEGRIEYDAERMGECRRFYEINLCRAADGFLFTPSVLDIVARCFAAQGLQEEGEPCRGAFECGWGLYCDDELACPSVCRARKPVGAACASSECAPLGDVPDPYEWIRSGKDFGELLDQYADLDSDCVQGMCRAPSMPGDACIGSVDCAGRETYCDPASNQCVERGSAGAQCTDGRECAEELWCDVPPGVSGAEGECRVRGKEDAPCQFARHCESDLRCVEVDAAGRGRCAPTSSEGGPCEDGQDCVAGLACVDRRCGAPPGVGASCAIGDVCGPDSVCVDEICRDANYPSEPCDALDHVCAGGVCKDGTCANRVTLGAACQDNDECTSRTCRDGTCVDEELCEERASGG